MGCCCCCCREDKRSSVRFPAHSQRLAAASPPPPPPAARRECVSGLQTTGGVYDGDMLVHPDGRMTMDGRGAWRRADGSLLYKGEFREGTRHGVGVVQFSVPDSSSSSSSSPPSAAGGGDISNREPFAERGALPPPLRFSTTHGWRFFTCGAPAGRLHHYHGSWERGQCVGKGQFGYTDGGGVCGGVWRNDRGDGGGGTAFFLANELADRMRACGATRLDDPRVADLAVYREWVNGVCVGESTKPPAARP